MVALLGRHKALLLPPIIEKIRPQALLATIRQSQTQAETDQNTAGHPLQLVSNAGTLSQPMADAA